MMFCEYGLENGKWHEDCKFDMTDWIWLIKYIKHNLKDGSTFA